MGYCAATARRVAGQTLREKGTMLDLHDAFAAGKAAAPERLFQPLSPNELRLVEIFAQLPRYKWMRPFFADEPISFWRALWLIARHLGIGVAFRGVVARLKRRCRYPFRPRACRQLSQMIAAARWTAAKKLRAVLS
jgi:hypothetical protein